MSKSEPTPDRRKQLREARARRDELKRSLLIMNGGNPNLYAGMGSNEGYDSTLCALRSEQALVDELSDGQNGGSKN